MSNINSTNFKDTITSLITDVEHPLRYTGNEFNIIKKEPDNTPIKIGLAFPDLYDVGMGYYGLHILYHILNRDEFIAAERVFTPWPDFEEKLRENSFPLYTLENKIPLNRLDLLGFSLTYELGHTNVLNMLDLAEIPLWQKDRSNNDPLIIAGGGSTYNPEPMAPFFDLYLIGDAEDKIVNIIKFVGTQKAKGIDRDQILYHLASKFECIYVPSLYSSESDEKFTLAIPKKPDIPKRIEANKVTELKSDFYPEDPIIPLGHSTQDRMIVEIMRGCTRGCRFCQAGMNYRPVRERTVDDIDNQIRQSLNQTGYSDISLLSLSTSDYNGLEQLIDSLSDIIISL